MKGKLLALGFMLVVGALVLSGCVTPTAEPETGLPNPASVYCEEQGYTLEMRTDEDGTYGVCIFPDGNECEEWAFFRGECGPTDQGQNIPLEGTGWVLVTLRGQSPLSGTTITAAFSEGEISGNGGCNNYSGPYAIDGNTLRFENIAMTEMACLEPEGVMEQEMAYLETLRAVAEARLSDGQLEMLDQSGEMVLRFERR